MLEAPAPDPCPGAAQDIGAAEVTVGGIQQFLQADAVHQLNRHVGFRQCQEAGKKAVQVLPHFAGNALAFCFLQQALLTMKHVTIAGVFSLAIAYFG